ncbi:MAG: hypothetical protein V4484_01015 [Pseudomonadota bacterium]
MSILTDPQISVKIKLLSTDRGGRAESIPAGEYRGILSARGQHFSFCCEMPADGLQLGSTITVGIEFLFPALALPFFKAGDEFNVWESGTIGYGRVLRVLAPEK